jgi:hypothetical protein
MKGRQTVRIIETDRDRFARTTKTTINEKTILTPSFAPRLTRSPNYDELEIIMRLRETQPTSHLNAYVVRLFDLQKSIDPRLASKNQLTLNQASVEHVFLKYCQNNVFFVDPSLEYLFYTSKMKNLASTPNLSKPLIEYINESLDKKEQMPKYHANWLRANHSKFWHKLDKDRRMRNQVIGELLDYQMQRKADVAIPPVPLITNESLMDLAIEINKISRELIRANYESVDQCATYFMLPSWILAKKESVKNYIASRIIDYVRRVPSKITIFKFKYLDIGQNRIIEREEIRKFLVEISKIREAQPDRLFMLLEGDVYASIFTTVGFDIVSTSLTTYDDDGGFSIERRGKWFDPKEGVPRSIEDVWTMYKNGGKTLACYCSACKRMNEKLEQMDNYEDIDIDEWNLYRREHYLLMMNENMKQTATAINNRQIELFIDKLANSELALLKDLIPRTL